MEWPGDCGKKLFPFALNLCNWLVQYERFLRNTRNAHTKGWNKGWVGVVWSGRGGGGGVWGGGLG